MKTEALKTTLISASITVVLLFLVEGIASYAMAFRNILGDANSRPAVLERIHTEYDPDLGWVNLADFFEEDMYGDDIFLRTNSMRIRANREYSIAAPEGMMRIVCSGDSFTLGYGVSNDETWCEHMARANKNVETINLGQGGYGIDQAYLWYKRDGGSLEHDIVFLAFINADFDRMMSASYHGYGKPRLVAREGKLEVDNVPVPQGSYAPSAIRLTRSLGEFRIYELMTYLAATFSPSSRERGTEHYEAEIQAIFSLLLEDMRNVAEARDATLIAVFLPTSSEPDEAMRTASRRDMVKAETERLGIQYFDLIVDAPKIFHGGFNPITPSHGHYSEAANRAVAAELINQISVESTTGIETSQTTR